MHIHPGFPEAIMAEKKNMAKDLKYIEAEAKIRKAIENGEYAIGERLPGEIVLARSFGISPMTLRQAVGNLCKHGIVERRHRSGTYVRRRERIKNIVLLTFNVSNEGSSRFIDKVVTRIRDAGSDWKGNVIGMFMSGSEQDSVLLVETLRSMNAGVVGILGFMNRDRTLIREVAKLFPCVLFNKNLPGSGLPHSCPDIEVAARLAADYFASRKFKRIGVVHFCTDHPLHEEMLKMFETELKLRKIPIDRKRWFVSPRYETKETILAWVEKTFASANPPDAMLVCPVTDAPERVASYVGAQGTLLFRPGEVRSGEYKWPTIVYFDDRQLITATDIMLDILRGVPSHRSEPASLVVKSVPQLFLPGNGSES
jgi:DNA-binding LacI/PurR family transcriptional regulator